MVSGVDGGGADGYRRAVGVSELPARRCRHRGVARAVAIVLTAVAVTSSACGVARSSHRAAKLLATARGMVGAHVLVAKDLPGSWTLYRAAGARSENRSLYQALASLAQCLHAAPIRLTHPTPSEVFEERVVPTTSSSGGPHGITGAPGQAGEVAMQTNTWMAPSVRAASSFVRSLNNPRAPTCLRKVATVNRHPFPGNVALTSVPKVGQASAAISLGLPGASGSGSTGSSSSSSTPRTASASSGATSAGVLPIALPSVSALIVLAASGRFVIADFTMAIGEPVPVTTVVDVLRKVVAS